MLGVHAAWRLGPPPFLLYLYLLCRVAYPLWGHGWMGVPLIQHYRVGLHSRPVPSSILCSRSVFMFYRHEQLPPSSASFDARACSSFPCFSGLRCSGLSVGSRPMCGSVLKKLPSVPGIGWAKIRYRVVVVKNSSRKLGLPKLEPNPRLRYDPELIFAPQDGNIDSPVQ